MKRSIYIFSNGELHRKQNTLYFQKEDGTRRYIPVENTQEIFIFGEVTINKKLLEFLSQKEILLHFFNHYGYYMGTFYPREHYNSGYLLLKQVEHYLNPESRLSLAKRFVQGALANMEKILQYYHNRGRDTEDAIEKIGVLKEKINTQTTTEELMALEGNAREIYYGMFDLILENDEFSFNKRTKRPPRNRLNALISFSNSLLYTIVLREIYKTHLDPRIGYLHTTNFRRFTLNLDVAEVFKPVIVDRTIFTLINKKILTARDFENKAQGIYLKENGRKHVVEEMDRKLKSTIKHEKLKRNISYETLILLELYKLEKHFLGEKVYTPFITRW